MIDPGVLARRLEAMAAEPNWRRFSLDKEAAALCAAALRALVSASGSVHDGPVAEGETPTPCSDTGQGMREALDLTPTGGLGLPRWKYDLRSTAACLEADPPLTPEYRRRVAKMLAHYETIIETALAASLSLQPDDGGGVVIRGKGPNPPESMLAAKFAEHGHYVPIEVARKVLAALSQDTGASINE